MTVASIIMQKISMRKSVSYVGLSRNKLYHKSRPRVIQIDPTVTKTVRKTGLKRPTYCTRCMVASVSREIAVPINRKQIQRIYRKTGMISPQKIKKDIIRSNRKLLKPTGPNQLWEMDMTYIRSGIDDGCSALT